MIKMKNKKRFLALSLCFTMALGLLNGCSAQPAAENSSAEGTGEKPYVVTMMFFGSTQDDETKIEEAINAISVPELNIALDILVVPWASAAEQTRLMLSGGEKLDLMMALASSAPTYVASKSVYDLNELIDEYGTNIKASMGEAAKIANINGYVYGVPNSCDWYTQTSIQMRKDWLEEAGFQAEDVKTIEDVEAVYAEVSKNHPEAYMLAMNAGQVYDSGWRNTDSLGDGWGVLMNYGEKPEVVNWFASEHYKELVERQYRWAQNGWISKDAATTTDRLDSVIGAGKAFSQVSTMHPSITVEASLNIGTEIVTCPLYDLYTTTTLTTPFYWSVARNSEKPEKAFQMLDFIYGNSEVANLLNWGIEGEHYVLTEDGHVTFPEGKDKSTVGYNAQFAYMLPNQFITHVWEGLPLNLHELNQENNAKAKRSCAYGFAYDGTSFSNEIAALNNVKNQYLDALNTGAVDPAQVLPQFLADLEAAGQQKIIDAKQQQLDAWLAQNK